MTVQPWIKYRVESDCIWGSWHPGQTLYETPTFNQGLFWLAFPLTGHNCWPKIASTCLPADGSWLLAHDVLITELKLIVTGLTSESPALWNSNIWLRIASAQFPADGSCLLAQGCFGLPSCWWIMTACPCINYRVEIDSNRVDIRVNLLVKLQHLMENCFGLLFCLWITVHCCIDSFHA
jgi:hypothetical protein